VTTTGGAGRGDGLLPTVATWLPVALCVAVYFVFQSGSLTLEVDRSIGFRCHAEEYGLVAAEIAHPGRRATDVFCEPGEGVEDDGTGTSAPTRGCPRTRPPGSRRSPRWSCTAARCTSR
jgi:hypothetical protein